MDSTEMDDFSRELVYTVLFVIGIICVLDVPTAGFPAADTIEILLISSCMVLFGIIDGLTPMIFRTALGIYSLVKSK